MNRLLFIISFGLALAVDLPAQVTIGGGRSGGGTSGALTNYSSPVITLSGATVIIDFNVARTNWAFSLPLTNAQTTLVLSNFPATPIRTGLSISATCGVTGTLVIPSNLKFIGTSSGITNYIAGSNYVSAIETDSINTAVIVVAPKQP